MAKSRKTHGRPITIAVNGTALPADCIVSNTPVVNEQALQQIELVLKGNIANSDRLRFRGRPHRAISARESGAVSP